MKIAILTTARSDFGPLKKCINLAAEFFEVDLLVAGSHFLVSRGETFREIEHEFGHFSNLRIVPFSAMDDGHTASAQVSTLANTQKMASDWFGSNHYDILLFLGDRWELWGVTLPAFLHGVPLAHISGGEVTEGVIDDCVRHAHTKISALHFAATSEFAKNISLMGEEDWRISVVGECGLDLIHNAEVASVDEVNSSFGVDLSRDTILVTFHPSTLDFQTPVHEQIGGLLNALADFTGYQVVFTAPGVEQGSDAIIDAIGRFVLENKNAILVNHLGSYNYLAVMQHAKVVVGNSSSGLVEAPSFGVPSINVGDRQKNRPSADSVQHVSYSAIEIKDAIELALSANYQNFARHCVNPYDPYKDGKNSLRIIQALEYALNKMPKERLSVKKFDVNVVESDWNYLLKEGGVA